MRQKSIACPCESPQPRFLWGLANEKPAGREGAESEADVLFPALTVRSLSALHNSVSELVTSSLQPCSKGMKAMLSLASEPCNFSHDSPTPYFVVSPLK